MAEYYTDDTEISSDHLDELTTDEQNSDKENSNEEN